MNPFILCILLMDGVSGFDAVILSVMEGDSVTLHTNVKTNQRDRMRWYFNDIRIAQITGDLRKICADDQCKEKFRDRLELDQTGSLTITDTRTTDSGLYHQETIISGSISEKIFNVTITGFPVLEAMNIKRKMEIKAGSDNGEAKTSGSDEGDGDAVLSALKTVNKGSSVSPVIVGVSLGLLGILVPVIVFIYWKSGKSTQNEPKRKNREETKQTCDDVNVRNELIPNADTVIVVKSGET